MPIIELARGESPLTQGDILEHVPLYITDFDGSLYVSTRLKSPLCMVISRPCVATHKDRIIVAEIEKYDQGMPKSIASFEEALAFFESQRDGSESPDCFYLGDIPNKTGRFLARLDALYTVSSKDRQNLISCRIASLNADFQRNLHLRLYNAFGNFGFDDVNWLPTADLKLIVGMGQNEIAVLEGQAALERQTRIRQESFQKKFDGKSLSQIEEKIKDLRESVKPYEDEVVRRDSSA